MPESREASPQRQLMTWSQSQQLDLDQTQLKLDNSKLNLFDLDQQSKKMKGRCGDPENLHRWVECTNYRDPLPCCQSGLWNSVQSSKGLLRIIRMRQRGALGWVGHRVHTIYDDLPQKQHRRLVEQSQQSKGRWRPRDRELVPRGLGL